MCGICGRLEFDKESSVSPSVLEAMADAIRHRGPDDEGFYISGQVGLGFRRLSIIDLSGGHQPLSNEDGTVWIVFNGEIYNYQELRQELLAKGHIFRSKSDTEVIVHLYEEYGTECVHRLRGMFGFAIWDGSNKSLFLARDRVGIKPLYYYVGKNFFSFGSEIKAILADPAVVRDINPQIIDRFLTYYHVPGRETLLRNVFKLEPGHILTVKDRDIKTWSYWDLDFCADHDHRSSLDMQNQLVDLLEESVQLHMISDVPIGFLLSGGLDSTAMLSLASKKTDKPISTFTIGFSSEGVVDERPFARLAAARFGSTHYEITISPAEFADFLPGYVWYMEEPVCDPASIALFHISKFASEHVKVLISGEGADEAFAGYQNQRNFFWFEQIRKLFGPTQKPVGRVMSQLGRLFRSRVLKKYAPLMGVSFEEYYFSRTSTPFAYFTKHGSRIYTAEMLQKVDKAYSSSVTRKLLSQAARFGVLEKMLYVDTKTWLSDDLLIKADRMTMANSVELRVPFLDHKFLEFAAKLPRNQKVRGWTMKYLEKKALSGHVPNEIVYRAKSGFPIPYESWLRDNLRNWVSDLLLDQKSLLRAYFNRKAIEELIEQNINGLAYPKDIFALIVLEIWHRTFIDQKHCAPDRAETFLPASA